ncbi:hypothetical protein POVWA2_003360 [Plasmodium ovale wallikeri]|uniref:Uncharacterized protein n=1 Tax=Plasmodium ovale wallikeri TaxID=864142 RepID=A0A1A8YIB8_PLAOA|nr:hypothetical protein POVWA1_003170 [Plasmodium ovale wallikeri]SBT31285.1 hypothetical protein POVWA2_003360 [Plasmodium ovale wallikeri]
MRHVDSAPVPFIYLIVTQSAKHGIVLASAEDPRECPAPCLKTGVFTFSFSAKINFILTHVSFLIMLFPLPGFI